MNEILTYTVVGIGYIICGLVAARAVFEYYCRYHRPSYHRLPDYHHYAHSKSNVHSEMIGAFLVWPLVIVVGSGYFLYKGAFRMLTSHPPMPVSKTERLTILEEKNKELEAKTGVIVEDKAMVRRDFRDYDWYQGL